MKLSVYRASPLSVLLIRGSCPLVGGGRGAGLFGWPLSCTLGCGAHTGSPRSFHGSQPPVAGTPGFPAPHWSSERKGCLGTYRAACPLGRWGGAASAASLCARTALTGAGGLVPSALVAPGGELAVASSQDLDPQPCEFRVVREQDKVWFIYVFWWSLILLTSRRFQCPITFS